MNKAEFLEEFIEVLQTEEEIDENTVLEELEEWDSLSKMATIAFLDKNFSIKVTFDEIKNFKTVQDIIDKAGI